MSHSLTYGTFEVTLDTREAHWPGGRAHLNQKETDLLVLLLKNPEKPKSKQSLYDTLWKDEPAGSTNRLSSTLHRLKRKLSSQPNGPLTILYTKGRGYWLRNDALDAPQQGITLPHGRLDLERGTLHCTGKTTSLSAREIQLLQFLAQTPNSFRENTDILTHIWGHGAATQASGLKSLVYRCRKKIEVNPSKPQLLQSKYGQHLGLFIPPQDPPPTADVIETPPIDTTPLPFVGRNDTLQHAQETLDSGVRCLTLLGPGGVGKTRLAQELIAHTQNLQNADTECVLCHFSGCASLEGALEIVAHQLDYTLPATGDWTTQATAIGEALAVRSKTMIVFDNVEECAEPLGKLLRIWIRLAASVQFVVTSRVRLRIESEQVLPIQGLSLAAGTVLFLNRARQVAPHLRWGATQRRALQDVVQRFEGNALALLMGAGQLKETPLDDWMETFQAKGTEIIDLNQILTHSWALLSPQEQRVLVQTVCFENGFSLEAAEEVLWVEDAWIDDILQNILDHSLMTLRSTHSDEPRFSLYESVRSFCQQKKALIDSDDGLQTRFVAYYTTKAEEWGRTLRGERSGLDERLMRLLHAEQSNMWHAFEQDAAVTPQQRAWLLHLLFDSTSNPEQYQRLLCFIEDHQDQFSGDIRTLLLWDQLQLYRWLDQSEAYDAFLEGFVTDPQISETDRLYLHINQARNAYYQSKDTDTFIATLTDALQNWPATSAPRAFLLENLAKVQVQQGKIKQAIQNMRAAIQAGRKEASASYLASITGNLGHFLVEDGRLDDGLELLMEQMQMTDVGTQKYTYVTTCWSIASVHLVRQEWTDAARYLEQGLTMARYQGRADFVHLMSALHGLVHWIMGDIASARKSFGSHSLMDAPSNAYTALAGGLTATFMLFHEDSNRGQALWARHASGFAGLSKGTEAQLQDCWAALQAVAEDPKNTERRRYLASLATSHGVQIPRKAIEGETNDAYATTSAWSFVVLLEHLGGAQCGDEHHP